MSNTKSTKKTAHFAPETYEQQDNNNALAGSTSNPTASHLEFLDLTNGTGGEMPITNNMMEDDNVNNEYDDDDDGDDGGGGGDNNNTDMMMMLVDSAATAAAYAAAAAADDDDDDEHINNPNASTAAAVAAASSAAQQHQQQQRGRKSGSSGGGGGRIGNIDPNTPGKVVESGREHTGRWTKEEHDAFLKALQMYGKEWKKVAAKVKTRTVVQTRTHAQKYFQKLQKNIDTKGGGNIDADMMIDMGLSESSSSASKHHNKMGTTTYSSSSIPTTRSTAIKNKKSTTPNTATTTPSVSAAAAVSIAPKPHRRSSHTTMNAAQVISTLSTAKPITSNFIVAGSSTSMTPPPTNPTPTLPSQQQPRLHGFSVDTTNASSTAPWRGTSSTSTSTMKIIAPDPSMMRGKFPEPSPAATGKRKLAEIAAARMLAGVASSGGDGPPTPPPPPSSQSSSSRKLKDAPTLPLFGSSSSSSGVGAGPLKQPVSLQIVNPASLGVSHNQKQHGGNSPVTPWDGQLEAIENEMDIDDDDNNSNNNKNKSTTIQQQQQQTGGVLDNQLQQQQQQQTLHPVNGPATSYGRTILHQAVCQNDVQHVQALLQDQVNCSSLVLQRRDDAGYAPLHSAAAIQMMIRNNNNTDTNTSSSNDNNDLVRLLLDVGADPTYEDNEGNTPLHWAARAGDKYAVELLLTKNAILDCKNKYGETPLHWAMRVGVYGIYVVDALLENGARPGILNNKFRRPIDVASEGFIDVEGSLEWLKFKEKQNNNNNKSISKELKRVQKTIITDRKETRANLFIKSAHSRTLVLNHPECLEHHPKSVSDWEAPDRVTTIMKRILPSSDCTGVTETYGVFPHEVTISQEFDRASFDLLSRVHSTEYLSFVNKLSKDLEKKLKESGGGGISSDSTDNTGYNKTNSPPPVVPFTPMVQRSMIKIDESDVKSGINSDTSFSAGSLRAARRAAGAVQHAVDCVLVGRNRNAFCVVRPPGHHAGINGLLEGGESCGFCIFNNVAAGALHAISDDRLLCDKCAIVDIDVHHGNGTEEIVRKCNDPSKLFFFSIHLFDNDKKKRNTNQFVYKFYPGTGSEDDLALNIINVPIVPLWKDLPPPPPPVKTHNTRNKAKASQEANNDDSSETSNARISSRASDIGSDAGNTAAANASSPRPASSNAGRLAYRQAIQDRLLPALRAFNPDLILISAGLDAARGDVGNARHERGRERMGLDLDPEDYAWTTRKILEIADICCQGRVVSVLEGGYGRTPPGPVPEDTIVPLDRSVFGECAIRHLHAMIDPYDAENRFQ